MENYKYMLIMGYEIGGWTKKWNCRFILLNCWKNTTSLYSYIILYFVYIILYNTYIYKRKSKWICLKVCLYMLGLFIKKVTLRLSSNFV